MNNANICLQLWQQLHFSQPSVRTTSIDQARNLIEVSLAHDVEPTRRPARPIHRLDVDVPFYDIRPPPGIRTATLETVELDIKLRGGDRLQVKPSTGVYGGANEIHWLEWFDDDADDSGSEMLLEAENYDEECYLPQSLDASSTLPDAAVEPTISDLQESVLLTYEMLKLLDAAIRRTISGSLERLPYGMVMKCNKSFTTLSSLAPSLFQPGHLPAVASRAVFLPTISRSLAAVHLNSGRTKALKTTGLSVLQSRAEPPDSSEEDVLRGEVDKSSERLSTMLWSTVERGLQDSMPDTRLKPLSVGIADWQYLTLNDDCLELHGMERLCLQHSPTMHISDEVSDFGSPEDFCSDSDDAFDDLDKYSEHEGDDDMYEDDSSSLSVGGFDWDYDNHFDEITQKTDVDQKHDEVWSRTFNNSTYLSDVIGVGASMFEDDTKSICESMGAMSMLGDNPEACSSSVYDMEDQDTLLT